MQETHKYTNEDGTIVWKPKQCEHTGICFRGLQSVFDPRRRPWIVADGATTAEITKQIAACPSGAISWHPKEQVTAE
jgi:uncharacterized Fe-S cluster protein YjdI